MKISREGEKLIHKWESLKLKGYLCPAKKPTIGWGHTEAAGGSINYADGTKTTKVILGKSITEAEANRIFSEDIAIFERHVLSALRGAEVNQHQFDALVSLCYNIGPVAFARSTVVKRIRRGDYNGVPAAFMMWVMAGGKKLQGLVNRRRDEVLHWRKGDNVVPEKGSHKDPPPRVVETLPPPKSMAKSRTGWAVIGSASAGTLAVAEKTIDTAERAAAVASSGTEVAMAVGPWVLLGLAIAGFSAFIWWDRRRKLREDLV